MNNGAILVMSGPSGCGKSSLLRELSKEIKDYHFSISTTTREIREGETHGVEYYFTTKKEFEQDIAEGNFLEWAKVHENYYGTSLKPIKEALKEGKLVVFDIDVQGHDILRKKLGNLTTSVFITTPTLNDLKKRLKKRGTDAKEVMKKRLANSQIEIRYIDKYDYFLINDDLQKAAEDLISIAKAAKLKSTIKDKNSIIEAWL